MTGYRIIDEPKATKGQQLVVSPMLILLAAIVAPLLLKLPEYGQYWLPFAWLILNGYWLGSPTLWRECLYAVLGLGAVAGMIIGFNYSAVNGYMVDPDRFLPYLRVAINAVQFIALYMVVFTQLVPFSVYQYVKQGQHESSL